MAQQALLLVMKCQNKNVKKEIMADSAAQTPATTNDGGGTNWTLYIGLGALLLTGGVAYWYFTKPTDKKDDKTVKKTSEITEGEKTEEKKEDAAPATTVTTSATDKTAAIVQEDIAKSKGISKVRTDHDGAYNYQKKNGVWYSAKKSTPDKWSSWGIDSSFAKSNPSGWAQAVADLDSRYPND